MANKPTLAYWDIRGITEPIRFLLHYVGVEFNDKRYNLAEAQDTWFKEKPNMGLDFPNLPYYLDGKLRITQSLAILRHLARKHKLVGGSEDDLVQLEVLEQQAVDLRLGLSRLVYGDNYEQARLDFIKTIPDKMRLISNYLGNKKYIFGSTITYVDFLYLDILTIFRQFESTAFDGFTNLSDYLDRLNDLPQIKNYKKGGVYHDMPYFGPYAKWANTRD